MDIRKLVESNLFTSIRGIKDAFTLNYDKFEDGKKFIQYLELQGVDYSINPSSLSIQVYADADSVEGSILIDNLRKLGKFSISWE